MMFPDMPKICTQRCLECNAFCDRIHFPPAIKTLTVPRPTRTIEHFHFVRVGVNVNYNMWHGWNEVRTD